MSLTGTKFIIYLIESGAHLTDILKQKGYFMSISCFDKQFSTNNKKF